ncbi:hypothetical protein [Motilimonas sp. 1_MG-2023]|uniref:hypothetical protein n=1 Tax=Motilimonas TaxID=1914248 RepID=UPI0026E2C032|nr:hypothetical protein [Motilimonas sp. 1_MG-2023]MDO6524961.1 hypothetical protein [Motilimonas sp. 1_MG-2023]
MVRLWRDQPTPIQTNNNLPTDCIFASGRQALQQGMLALGLGRVNRVAYPEYSSACVVSCIARVASPIPLQEVIKFDIDIDALLVYEQWGWPYSEHIISQLITEAGCAVILDCVDSPDAVQRYQSLLTKPENSQVQLIISLSKCLGFEQGGLLYANNSWQMVAEVRAPKIQYSHDKAKCTDINKTYVNSAPQKETLADADLEAMLVVETAARQSALQHLSNLGLTSDWPNWMNDIIKQCRGAPGIAPLFSNLPCETLLTLQHELSSLGIETAIYNFNFSGHPLKLAYRPCLAFPIHSQLKWSTQLEELLLSFK